VDGDAVIPGRPDLPSASVPALHLPDLDLSIERPADGRVLVAVLAAAVTTDVAVRAGGIGAAGAMLVAIVAGAILATGRVRNPQGACLIVAAPLFGVWLMLRMSPWLPPLDVLAAALLLAVGASLARGGSVLDLSPIPLLIRGTHAALHAVVAPGFVAGPSREAWRSQRRGGRRPGVVRGVLIALPLLVVLGLLLGSADPVFASWFSIPADPATVVAHVMVLAAAAWGMAALLRVASARTPEVPEIDTRRLGPVEALVVLAGLDALFAAFVVSQVVAALGGARTVLETSGLTYAQYARSGFFQLVAVATITLVVLLSLRACTRLDSRRSRAAFLGFALIAICLTLAIVGVAVHRMQLYERAFGLTMLRLYVEVATLGIAAVFVALAVRLAGVGARRAWLTQVALGLALTAVLALDAMNPEAVVARRNADLAVRTGRVDVVYLSTLSDDAVPTMVALAPQLKGADRAELSASLCARPETGFHGWAAWNAARTQARDALARFCGREPTVD
jgi:hypothetical protein